MTNPYAVPAEELDAVHVDGEELVAEQSSPLRHAAGGAAVHPYGDGAGPDADGD